MAPEVVFHPKYGRGVAQVPRNGGFEWQVRFDDRVIRWVRLDQLQFEDGLGGVGKQRATASSQNHIKYYVERKIIESLRLGIVPDNEVMHYTVGRDGELSRISQWLESPDFGAYVLVGNYGTGKTHLLRHIFRQALEDGYAVSFVEMDSQERPFSKPKRVYGQIVENLRWIEGNDIYGFRHLVKKSLEYGYLKDNHYFSHLQGNLDEHTWHWIEARDASIRPDASLSQYRKLPGLFDYSTTANIYCYLLSTLGSLVRHRPFGLKGLLLIFDEAEVVTWNSSIWTWERSFNFMDALICTARGDDSMLESPDKSGFIYAGNASNLRFLYQPESGLKVLFGFTSVANISFSWELPKLEQIELSEFDQRKRELLADKIFNLYGRAYGVKPDKLAPRVSELSVSVARHSSLRGFVKSVIESLDIARAELLGLTPISTVP